MEDDLKNKMEDEVLLRLFNNKNLKNKWFWDHREEADFHYATLFWPNKKDNLKKNGRRPQKKNGRRPQQKMKMDCWLLQLSLLVCPKNDPIKGHVSAILWLPFLNLI